MSLEAASRNVGDVIVRGFSGQDGAETLGILGILPGKILQLVHSLEIEGDASLATIDFEGVVIFPTRCESGMAVLPRTDMDHQGER